MQFNGVDLLSVHPSISINKEIPPGAPARELRTIANKRGEILAGVDLTQGEYVVRVNIAGKTRREAWQVRALLAAWATSSGEKTAPLVPTHWPQVAYNAVLKSIEPAEFVFGHGTVEVVFALLDPVPYEQAISTAGGTTTATMDISGAGEVQPEISFVPASPVENLKLTLDGNTFFAIKGSLPARAAVAINMAEGALIIDGEHAEARIDYTATNWHPGFTPGAHTMAASTTGSLQARWHNKWA